LIGTRSGQELSLPEYIFHRIFIENSLHKKKSNIKVDIRHSAVGLRCRNPPRHCSQLTTWLILLIETPVEGVLYEYPMKNIFRKGKFLPTSGSNQRYFPGL
jgi:hypothetical protein